MLIHPHIVFTPIMPQKPSGSASTYYGEVENSSFRIYEAAEATVEAIQVGDVGIGSVAARLALRGLQ